VKSGHGFIGGFCASVFYISYFICLAFIFVFNKIFVKYIGVFLKVYAFVDITP
jgi:hypothetical protein